MNETVYIVRSLSKGEPKAYAGYYSCEPQQIPDGSGDYCGGFGNLSDAAIFTDFSEAKRTRNRMAKIYRDLDTKFGVVTTTRKKIFQARLGQCT